MRPAKRSGGRREPLEGEAAAARLAAVGLRRTPRRVRLLALLMREQRPMSHQDIHDAVGPDRINRVSVYRALEAFVESGLVHRAFVDDRTWLYESADRCADDHCHPHFTCRSCGRITCLVHVVVPVMKHIGAGYVAERQQVHITGLCPGCHAGERE